MLIEAFYEHFDPGLYIIKCQLLIGMMEDRRRAGMLSVFDCSPYEHFNVNIMQAYIRTSKKRPTKIMGTVDVMKKRYMEALSYEEKNDYKPGRSDKKIKRIERNGLLVVRDGITFKLDEMALAAAVSVHKSLTASFQFGLVKNFNVNTI